MLLQNCMDFTKKRLFLEKNLEFKRFHKVGFFMVRENYVVVTPCKNEEQNLPALASSIINNTIKPRLWILLNDGSTDNTSNILDDLEKKYNWIKVVHEKESVRDLGLHYSDIVNKAIKCAFETCEERNIPFEYVGLIDADMILDNNFFEKIIDRLEKNPNLGVCSGTVAYTQKNKKILEKGRSNHPIGGLRVWRKKCLEDTGGFPKSYSADSVSNVLAILKGWDTKKYEDIIGIETRQTSSAEGLWKGFLTRGKSDYYRGYHPAYVIFKFIKYSTKFPYYIGTSYLLGYIIGITRIKNKIDIPEVRAYYRNKHLELVHQLKKS